MAGAILTSLVKGLTSLALRASTSPSTELSSSAEQELKKLESIMKKIHAMLEDAEEKDISDYSEQLRLQELKEVAYDAEDAVDEYEYEVLHAKLEARRQATANHMGNKYDKVILDLDYYHPEISISNELAGRVINIRERFKEITDDWDRLTLPGKVSKRRCTRKWKPMETISYFGQVKTFGREDEKNRIIKWLLQEEESNGDTISVLGIVGMGGLGKTTLAQMSYHDARVRQHFSSRGWVYVYEDFDVPSLMKKICKSFCNVDNTNELNYSINFMSLSELHWKLKVILDGKKFLLVLDDVWNQKIELWSTLKTLLVGAGVGKILVTTRDESVAQIMQTTPPIKLGHLSFDDSWLLFKNIVYEGRDHSFLEIGKKIVNKCGGLPLAIKVLAGILRWEDEEEAWVVLLESELWELDEEGDDILPALKLSYDHLPIELKQCFMYLCLFPKGSELYRPYIVRQWMSHGFIQPKGKKMEEDVGNDYCNEFLHRSLLKYDDMTKSKDTFIMHDLIHDLVQFVAKDEYLLLTNLKSHDMIPKTIRHLSVYIKDKLEIINMEFLREAEHLRTLMVRVPGGIQIMGLLPNLTCLRTLVLDTSRPLETPESIGCLKHLRYLDINHATSIPASVYSLHYLQTLNLENSEVKISRDVGDLINLRHLTGDGNVSLPREVAGLTSLQTLPCITLGVGSGDSERWKIKDLRSLSNLRGDLLVRGLQSVAWPDVTPPEVCLKDKRGVETLSLVWDSDRREELMADVDERLAAQVLDYFQPYRDLKSMWIYWYPGVELPTWLGHELPTLQRLCMDGMKQVKSFVAPFERKKSEQCDGFEWRYSLNPPAAAAASTRTEDDDVDRRRWFPSLEELTIFSMDELEDWQGAEDRDFFPRLRRLFVGGCPKLRTIPSLSHLDRLEIVGCPELRRLPSLPSLTNLSLGEEISPELLFGCRCLSMLRTLEIGWYRGVSLSFPNDGGLDSLEHLSIRTCLGLRSVEGLGGLASLHHLEITSCRLLQISPDERLPPNLKGVEIRESPGAEEWYQNQVLGVSECQAIT